MPESERAAPLFKTAVAVTRSQWERLRERGKVEERSFSYYVRTAIDKSYPDQSEQDSETEAVAV